MCAPFFAAELDIDIFSLFLNRWRRRALSRLQGRSAQHRAASRRAAVTAQSAGGVVLLRDGAASLRRGGEEREDGGLGRGLNVGGGACARCGGVAAVVAVVLVGARGEQRADDVDVAAVARPD